MDFINLINIKNLRRESRGDAWDVRIDRRTIFGNPFNMQVQTKQERDKVCQLYDRYFHEKIKDNIEFKKAIDGLRKILDEYGGLNLFCWCAPKRCHGETIRQYLL